MPTILDLAGSSFWLSVPAGLSPLTTGRTVSGSWIMTQVLPIAVWLVLELLCSTYGFNSCTTGAWHQWVGQCNPQSSGYHDGLKDTARFKQPRSMCMNARGQLIVADAGNHCIRAVTPEGKLR